MTTQAILRVILGPDNSQRVTFSAGLPSTVAEMETNIKTQCQIMEPFRLQFMDAVFGNEFMNLISIEEIQDKATHPANLKTKDVTETAALSAIEKTTVGIYVTRETPGIDISDVGIIIEGVVVLQDLDNVALATAMLFGLFYSLNMKNTFEVIQKVVMELDVTQLSRKAQSFKTKLLQ